jgi:hypothetical protein
MSTGYRKTPASSEEILRLIAKSPAGRTLLERFLPHFTRGRVSIVAYPAELVAKLREVLPADQPIGACFEADPSTGRGRIFHDFGSPIGVLAPFLVHEIAHSLDPRAWEKRAAKAGALALETEAFHVQFRFTQELRERDPEYDLFLRERFPKTKMLHELLEPSDISALYSFEAGDDEAA